MHCSFIVLTKEGHMHSSKKLFKNISILILLGLIFLFFYFKSHFLPWATVNNVAVGGLNVQQAQEKLVKEYRMITIHLKQNDVTIPLILEQPYKFSKSSLEKSLHHSSIHLPPADKIKDQLLAKIEAADFGIEHENQEAVVSHTKQKFVIQPEKQGSTINRKQLISTIYHDLVAGNVTDTYNLKDFYTEPKLTSKNLESTVRDLNRLLTLDKSFILAKKEIPLSKSMFFATVNDSGKFDSLLITQLIQQLNREYSTVNRPVDFINVHEEHLRFKNVGNYGWYIDTEKAVSKLLKQLPDKDIKEIGLPIAGDPAKQPLHVKKNYIEVDLDNQKMYCFHEGKRVVSTDIITGQFTKGTATVPGFHTIMDKQQNTYLSGALITGDGSYRVPVNYWMPFLSYGQTITEIGIHDTEHKKEAFGDKEAFKTDLGSYGCINTPLEKVAKIYKYSYIGMPVFVYGHTYDEAPGEYDKPVDYGEEI